MPHAPTTPRTEARPKTARPPLYKVILLNDDFTPRDFVVTVLKAVFRMGEGEALGVMLAAHQLGAAVVAVFTREIAEEKILRAHEMAAAEDHPLTFTSEKE
ncbi:ATP-dependent Clp protease adaptor protein ClpS [Palleronia marisminoris]|uniref:ATP-dependent Clp protease adapter protein ClpS n=1 Tax=Palleronia marisminoris TaxID=315423 RepID=A0A1Y5TG61_9RHOB|nr:ATP-dependent Clp protease adaptor ClpS [Palleronia marisminoris]SFH38039.1 ATP-dependent Clp protease adaptor protein ClpS [Palleronia marisminoris]SLN62978.1 ATP-dependent Clp protease adapter protein ClpS [Palleronia marisminoris]